MSTWQTRPIWSPVIGMTSLQNPLSHSSSESHQRAEETLARRTKYNSERAPWRHRRGICPHAYRGQESQRLLGHVLEQVGSGLPRDRRELARDPRALAPSRNAADRI